VVAEHVFASLARVAVPTDRTITLDGVRTAVATFAASFGADGSDTGLVVVTGDEVDLSLVEHRRALHRWLNGWGCRIRYARPGEPDLFDAGVATWWSQRRSDLASVTDSLSALGDDEISRLGAAFEDLTALPIARNTAGTERTMGATASAKALYALRPRAVMPWDLAIAERLHGGRDATAFVAHLTLGRDWARQLMQESGWDEARLAAELGQPGASLARLLDQYCYVRFTLDRRSRTTP
jgi:hypothetical protein